jgi:S-sulfosulfanyl-L-cysteine sulfohydrolase
MNRREFLQVSAAAAALWGVGANWSRVAAQQKLTQDELLRFEDFGNVTIVHLTDIHAHLKPIFFREPSINLGVGDAKGKVPHISGLEFLKSYGIDQGTASAYALSHVDFEALAKTYGRMGGMDRIATVVKSIRSSREDKMLLLDGGDTWQGSFTANLTKGQDMVDAMNLLKPDAMTGHFEFTYGTDRVKEIKESLAFPFLGQNIFDDEWQEPAFDAYKMFERGGVKVAVVGQAFPYTPIANPRWMFPNWSFGIRDDVMQKNVDKARAEGAQLVVLLSHNGFDVDRKLATRVKGIDVILSGHTHDALPEAVKVASTLIVATGSHGKFVSRLDLDVKDGTVKDFRYKLIPVFADVISPDAEMAAHIKAVRAPYEKELARVLGKTESLLYRRGNFNGTMDDLLCQAMMAERDTELALSPGFRWGTSLLPGQDITMEDIYDATAMTYPSVYRSEMTGQTIKDIMEDVADNLFNIDPYYQQGGDMVRVGGLAYTMDVNAAVGTRISEMTVLKTGEKLDAAKTYTVSGWASINENVEGPPIWDVAAAYITKQQTIRLDENRAVKVIS